MVDISYYYSSCVFFFMLLYWSHWTLDLPFMMEYIARIITEERSFKSYLNVLYPEEKIKTKRILIGFYLGYVTNISNASYPMKRSTSNVHTIILIFAVTTRCAIIHLKKKTIQSVLLSLINSIYWQVNQKPYLA